MNTVDLPGFVNLIRHHVSKHGFHFHDSRHFIETYSNRQAWEIHLHPDDACTGPLCLCVTVEAEASALVAFEGAMQDVHEDEEPDQSITVPVRFDFSLPPLANRPDLLVLTTELAGIAGMVMPLSVEAVDTYVAVSDGPERTLNITSRIELPLALAYSFDLQNLPCELLEKAHEVCFYLLERVPDWMGGALSR